MRRLLVLLLSLSIVLSFFVGCTYFTRVEIPEGLGIIGSEVGYINETEDEVLYPGASGTAHITVITGNDIEGIIELSLVSPNPLKVKEGYEPFPKEYFNWISISPTTFYLDKNDRQDVTIGISMPADSDYVNKKAEVRILARIVSQTGIVRIAVEAKWYIVTGE